MKKNQLKNDYPVLNSYLKNKEQKNEDDDEVGEDKYSLDNLNDFNKALNLFNDAYSNQITRDDAERQKINTSELPEEMENLVTLINNYKILVENQNNRYSFRPGRK